MNEPLYSIAIETTGRAGGVALGRDDDLLAASAFDSSRRHATQVVARLDETLRAHGVHPTQLAEVYVSVGPGSFTGTRVGVTVARTLAQAVPSLRCAAVSTPRAIAEAALEADWTRLAVVLAAKEGSMDATRFERGPDGRIVEQRPLGIVTMEQVMAACGADAALAGEALEYVAPWPGARVLDARLHAPTAEGVWHVGRQMARQGAFTDLHHLLPVYPRKAEAVRLWEQRHGGA